MFSQNYQKQKKLSKISPLPVIMPWIYFQYGRIYVIIRASMLIYLGSYLFSANNGEETILVLDPEVPALQPAVLSHVLPEGSIIH